MNLLNFMSNFADEESCVTYLKEQRERRGVVCKHCGCTEHRWDAHKRCFECRNCHSRQSLRSGTVMQNSKLPFRYWIATMFLLMSTKKSFSTEEIRRQLGHKRYQPVWEMVCKLRDVMGKRDAQYSLDGQVELDDGFFTTERPEEEKDTPLKRGRGSQKKSKVVVMVESETVTDVAKKHLEPSVELTTDDSTSYHKLGEHVQKHQTVISDKKNVEKILPWVHIAISNAKRLLLDMHHRIKHEYLQYYLNEFCYKFNRRYFGEKLFDRVVLAAISYNTDFKSRTYRRTTCG